MATRRNRAWLRSRFVVGRNTNLSTVRPASHVKVSVSGSFNGWAKESMNFRLTRAAFFENRSARARNLQL